MKVNLGCGKSPLDEYINVDRVDMPGVDYVFDLSESEWPPPFALDTVEHYLMSHVLEHIPNPLSVLERMWVYARPGATADIRVPYGSSDDAWEDPTHVRPYFLKSWGFFGQPNYWRADYGYRGDWRARQVEVVLNSSWRIELGDNAEAVLDAITTHRNVVVEMRALLEAVKPIRPPLRELQEPVKLLVSYT